MQLPFRIRLTKVLIRPKVFAEFSWFTGISCKGIAPYINVVSLLRWQTFNAKTFYVTTYSELGQLQQVEKLPCLMKSKVLFASVLPRNWTALESRRKKQITALLQSFQSKIWKASTMLLLLVLILKIWSNVFRGIYVNNFTHMSRLQTSNAVYYTDHRQKSYLLKSPKARKLLSNATGNTAIGNMQS